MACATTSLFSAAATATVAASTTTTSSLPHRQPPHNLPSKFKPQLNRPSTSTSTRTLVSSSSTNNPTAAVSSKTGAAAEETVFFDGGAHYGDLVANLLLGFTLVWLPLTVAAVSRAFYLRYRFTNLRVTVISGLTGEDRSDFSYEVIKDVQVVPRFIGEWGDVVITLQDGTKVDLRSVPKFRQVAKYCLAMAANPSPVPNQTGPKGF